jgi:hypothetical protein
VKTKIVIDNPAEQAAYCLGCEMDEDINQMKLMQIKLCKTLKGKTRQGRLAKISLRYDCSEA